MLFVSFRLAQVGAWRMAQALDRNTFLKISIFVR
jgi:hypothetical protein